MSNNKKTIGVDVLYGYSKKEETLPTEWLTTIYDNIATEGGILWVKCLARYVDGSVEEMITSHYVASDEDIDVNNNNEDLYAITMTIYDCGDVYDSGVVGVYSTFKDAEDMISHLCRNEQESTEGPSKNGYCLGSYAYYAKPSEGYMFIIDKFKKNMAIGNTLIDVVLALDKFDINY